MGDLKELLQKSIEMLERMTLEEQEKLLREQAKAWAEAEARFPKPKYRWVNGVKVYDSIEDYFND